MVTLLVADESCKSEGEDCDGYCHLSHTVTVGLLLSLFTATYPFPSQRYSDFKRKYCYQRGVRSMLCWPSTSAWRSHP